MFLPVCEADLVDFADSLASTVPVTGGPLGNSIILESRDLLDVGSDGSDGVDLVVGVSQNLLDESLLVFLGLCDVCVFGVGHAFLKVLGAK